MNYYAKLDAQYEGDTVLYKKYNNRKSFLCDTETGVMSPVNGWEYNRAKKASRSMPYFHGSYAVELLQINQDDMDGVVK